MPTLATPAVAHNRHADRASGSWHPPVPAEAHRSLPCWRSSRHWLTAVKACLSAPAGREVLKATKITAATVLLVALVDARAADKRTGRGVATAHETVSALARVSVSTVRRARGVLEALGLAVTVLPGRYMTNEEREAARRFHGGHQVRFASVRALVLPRHLASVQNEHLPRRGHKTPISPKQMGANARCRARRGRSAASFGSKAVGPRPLPLQRLAGQLAARLPWTVRGRHVGALCDALAAEGVDPRDWTAGDLLAAIDQDYARRDWIPPAPADLRNPLGLLRVQLRRILGTVEPPQARRRREAAAARATAERFRRDLERARLEAAPPERAQEHVNQIRAQLRELRRQTRYASGGRLND